MADQLKAEGNAAFAKKDFNKAIECFTKAIELDASNHVLYSNRSACYASQKKFDKALEDAEKTTQLKPDWAKGYSRKGAALHGQGDLVGALDAYQECLKMEPSNAQAKQGLASVKDAINREAAADGQTPDMGLGSIFQDPNWIGKLSSNPKTAAYLGDRAFMEKLAQCAKNPSRINEELRDPRMMQVIAVLLGLNIEMPGGAGPSTSGASEDTPSANNAQMSDAPSQPNKTTPPPKEPTPEPEEEDEEAKKAKENKAKADQEKALGTEKYKKRQFDEAIEHYTSAWELHKDITYLTNRAAAKFEKCDYEGCIEDCKLAIEEGRSVMADFKLIAKAFGRIGNAYQKLGDLPNAIEYYQRSLTEHRTPDVLAKLRAKAYIDPEKAEQAREEGNKYFKEADWPGAVKAYTEMIQRAPEDPRGYSNRAAALAKLMSFPEAVKDCDEAIKRDPKFMRAYIRKAQAQLAMRDYNKCLDTVTAAQEADTEGKHGTELENLMRKCLQNMYAAREGETEEQTMERIQKDPEIASIISDPVMQSILQQAKTNPAALNEHMKNPIIRQRIQRLMMAGVIRLG
ncbi:heat shock protein STI1 [Terfezia claveryi]|nr:heat shock protein STI1 [Terfezia claveryi]